MLLSMVKSRGVDKKLRVIGTVMVLGNIELLQCEWNAGNWTRLWRSVAKLLKS